MKNEKSSTAGSSSHIFDVSFWVTLIINLFSKNINIFPKRNKQYKTPLYNNRGLYTNFVTIEPVKGGNA